MMAHASWGLGKSSLNEVNERTSGHDETLRFPDDCLVRKMTGLCVILATLGVNATP